ncbi:MAG: hypothetical protein QXI12_02540 [Candidatus Methanomethyliaceae archaeon]
MDVKSFADELLRVLADTGLFQQVALRTEGPIADGQAHVREELFLRFYFNEDTGTIGAGGSGRRQKCRYDIRR